MTDVPIVSVRGEVVREVEPELARFSVTMSARDKDRQATLARLRERVDALRTVLDEYAEIIERRETAGMHVYPETRGKGERVTAYSGSVTTTVTVRDFSSLGEMMLRLSDADQSHVSGPWWSLRPDSPVHREARHAAIADAIIRAREYAEAVGAGLDRLIELADSGVGGREAEPYAMGMRTMSAGGQPELQLDPQRQTVRATIEARFAMTEPTAL